MENSFDLWFDLHEAEVYYYDMIKVCLLIASVLLTHQLQSQSLCRNSSGTVKYFSGSNCPQGFSHINNAVRSGYLKDKGVSNSKLDIVVSQKLPFATYIGGTKESIFTAWDHLPPLHRYLFPSGNVSATTYLELALIANFNNCKNFHSIFTIFPGGDAGGSRKFSLISSSGSLLSPNSHCTVPNGSNTCSFSISLTEAPTQFAIRTDLVGSSHSALMQWQIACN